MRNYYMYAHGGSGNHGCEAIVKSTIELLGVDVANIYLFSERPDEDIKYGIDEQCSIIQDVQGIRKTDFEFILAYMKLVLFKNYTNMDQLLYKKAFSICKSGDIAFSIGGDNYCYANVDKYIMLHRIFKKKGLKTVLWGCSVEPKLLEMDKIRDDIKQYDLITARESITYNALKEHNPNTKYVADPAFCLPTKKIPLPNKFIPNNTVGINLSPMIVANEQINGITSKNYYRLIEFILEQTDMNVALVPHVVWEDGNDFKALQDLYERYYHTHRVCLVEDHSCEELKYIISQCRFFVGARTHSTIAAYSSCVPTLVLGYSVKSRGIARDLFGEEDHYVIQVQKLASESELAEAFSYIVDNEMKIRERLTTVIPIFKERAKSVTKDVKRLL